MVNKILGGPHYQQYHKDSGQYNTGTPVNDPYPSMQERMQERSSPINDVIAQLNNQIESFWSESGALESTLQPILTPSVKTDGLGAPCEQPQSPLHEALLSIYNRLESIRQNLAEIRSRVTV